MVEEYIRPLHINERGEISDLIEKLPSPWRPVCQYGIIIAVASVIALTMGVIIWAIMSAGWSEMMVGTLVLFPGGIALLSTLVALLAITRLPRMALEEARLRREALALRPERQAILTRGEVSATRVQAVSLIEIVLDEDFDYIYLFELADGTTYYYETNMMEHGEWPSNAFEIVRGVDADTQVWERITAMGAALEPARYIDEPWCYDGFERLLHRHEGDEAFARGVYNEAPEALVLRLLGEKAVDEAGDI